MSNRDDYRGDGLRHSVSVRYLTEVNPKVNVLYWDGDNIVAEQLDHGELKTYLRGHDLIARTSNDMVYFYLHDDHGSISQIVNTSGTVKTSYEFDAFGTEKNPKKEDDNPFRYCGKYFDFETNTYYLRARSYRTTTGRFLTEDPYWNPQNMIYGEEPVYNGNTPVPDIIVIMASCNLYAYCNSNPINLYDLLGLAPGDKFSSMDKAAIDFGRFIGPKSIGNNWEYRSYIYSWQETITHKFWFASWETTETFYTYTEPYTDEWTNRVSLEHNPTVLDGIPEGKTHVATAHTHAGYNTLIDGEFFSDSDLDYAQKAQNGAGVPLYLLTPKGYLLKYDPAKGKEYDYQLPAVSKDMPYDVDAPGLKSKAGWKGNGKIPGEGYENKNKKGYYNLR